MQRIATVKFTGYAESVMQALDGIDAGPRLPSGRTIILKPNLTNDSPPPVTTPVEMVEAVYLYCRRYTDTRIVIGEGCGSGTTRTVFQKTGYADMAKKHGLELIDFNTTASVRLQRDDMLQLKEFHLPRIAEDAYIISIPVLKDHSFTVTTIAMKNMFGLAPEPIYGGSWNKSRLHTPSTHHSVVDICRYKKPDLCVVDASVALSGMHLYGTPRKLDTIIAGFDPVAVDAAGSRLMGHDPRQIEYLALADGLLGKIYGGQCRPLI